MTKEQAIKTIKEHCYFANLVPIAKEALEMAIKALEQQPSGVIGIISPCKEQTTLAEKLRQLEQPTSDDCVSRTQALKELKESAEHHANDSREEVLLRRDRDIIRALPPVTPTRKSGLRWIERFDNEDKWLECPHCHKDSDNAYAYCPNCGASFKEEKRGNLDGSN